MVVLPGPLSFRVLPWAPHTGWLLCDLFLPDGRPVPFSSRGLMARQIQALAARNLRFTAGVEIECHILTRRGDPAADGQPATPALLNPGCQSLTIESRLAVISLNPRLQAGDVRACQAVSDVHKLR